LVDQLALRAHVERAAVRFNAKPDIREGEVDASDELAPTVEDRVLLDSGRKPR